MRKFGLVMLMPLALFAQELVSSFSIDTSVYERPSSYYTFATSGPGNEMFLSNGSTNMLMTYHKKGTEQYDIFSFTGLVGSILIPTSAAPRNCRISSLFISQTFLDNDPDFECIANYSDSTSSQYKIKVFDNKGNIILSDNGSAKYGFDGQNTYVYSEVYSGKEPTYKVWKFRSNISSASHALSKTTASPGPMMAYMPSGDFRVSLQPVTGGTSIKIFDMLGRQIFQKSIQNIREPTSFIIPSYSMPNNPFIAKVNNDNGSFVKKGIPVR